MSNSSDKLKKLGICIPDVLLPADNIDIKKWAVIACDQFSSEKEYWQDVKKFVGDSPSTLNIIFPECYLEDADKEERIKNINAAMSDYLKKGVFKEYKESFILVRRANKEGVCRWGLMLGLDLDEYSFEKGSKTLIRATEGTIIDRIPPRKKIRKDAELELPHIMVLISDKKRSIIEKLAKDVKKFNQVYDTDLMCDGGHITAWAVNDDKTVAYIADAFEKLYNSLDKNNRLLFAMGDGNHSFATAKSVWEDVKKTLSAEQLKNHPARYCMVEIENIFDEGLLFEPIHRVFFDVEVSLFEKELKVQDSSFAKDTFKDLKSLLKAVNADDKKVRFAVVKDSSYLMYSLEKSGKNPSAPAVIQKLIDKIVLTDKIGKIDYTHGIDSTIKVASKGNNFAVLMPDISKDDFFASILRGGAFPRKTFSIGEAVEKRYYMEARRIK